MTDVIDTIPSSAGDNQINYLQTFYHDLVEAAGNVFFVTDDNGYFVYVNSAVEPVLGFEPAQIIGTHFTTMVDAAWREQVVAFYVAQFKNFVPETTMEFEVVSANGEARWVEQIVRLMIVDGEVMGCNGLLHDISRRKFAETARQDIEKSYLFASENAGSIVFLVAQGGTFTYVNPAMEEAIGYSRGELIGTSVYRLIHPDHHNQIRHAIQLYHEGRLSAPRSELQFIRKDGSICWLDVVATWGDIDGRTTMIGSALNISERKRIEQELKDSQFFVEKINTTIPDAIYVFDIEDWNVIYSNRPFAALLGYTSDEALAMGKNALLEMLHPSEHERYYQRMKLLKVLKAGELQEATYQMQHKDGSIRWLHLRNTAFEHDSDGNVKRILGLTRDVTEQVEAQDAIHRSEEQLRKSLQYQRALNEINFELGDIESFEGMCKRAIELGQSKLEFDRIALLLFDHKTETIMGTYGVDAQGQLRDERQTRHALSSEFQLISKSVRGKQRVRVREDVDLYDNWQVVSRGWNAMALMWKDGHVIGWLAADNLIHHQPVQEYQLEVLGMLAISLEHFYVQKEAEAKLLESNRRYDQLVANMPGMVYRIRRNGNNAAYYEYLSPRCKDVTGLDPEVVMADANVLLDQIEPEDRVKYDAMVRTNLEEPQVFRWEGAVIVNGEQRWRRVESRPYHLPDGSIVWDGVMSDVTESRRADEALRQSEERYRTMVEEHSELITRYTPDGTFTFVNESLCRYFNQPREYYIGRNILDDIPTDYHASILQRISQSRVTGRPFQYEHPVRMANGSVRWFEWTDTPIFDASGEVVKFQSVGRDIDVRKRTESDRNDYINRLEIIRRVDMELTESLNFDHVLQIALDAALHISQASAGAIHVLEDDKLRVVHVVGNFPSSMVGTTVSLKQGIVGRVAKRGIPELITDVNLDKDYMPNVVETRAQMTLPLMSQDRLIGVINVQTAEAGIFTRPMFDFLKVLTVRIASALDNARLHLMTERHLSEITDLYQQVSELEQLKTQMIRIAAHDLRNPLGVISGYVQILSDALGEQLSETNWEQITTIKDSINRIDKITRDILTLERISAGHDMATDRVDLKQMICTAFTQIKVQAALKHQTYELTTPDTPLYVKADRFLLPETVVNLMTNAVKYTPEGGTIRVELAQKGHRAVFTVQDNGYGIPADQQENLFQAFFRVKTRETRGISGTGLGLHLVKSIIERHKGEMHFKSEYQKGSTFGFELPLEEVHPPRGKRKASTGK
ncbi:MAG: PAS domain S-box protein [Chloroflexota bacterium]